MPHPDILIVGAGLAGASLAWHLARTGAHRILLLEQADQPFAEASAQNAGMVRRLVPGASERELAMRSHALLEDLPDGGRDWEDAPPFRRTGAVIGLAAENAELDAAADALARAGVPIESLAPDALATVAPALDGAPLHHAFWLPDEGVADAWSLGQGFLRGALARGAILRCGTRVASLELAGSRVVGVRTADGSLHAGLVVLAAGAWSRKLAGSAGLVRPLVPLARHLFQSAPHPTAHRDHPWCWIHDAGVYVRPEAGGFLCSPCDESETEPAIGPGSVRSPDPYWRAVAQDKLERCFPALAGLRLERGWVGLRTFAADRRPVFGLDPEIEGLAWLAGLGGSGVSCAFALGAAAAEAIRTDQRADFAGGPARE